jgi:hypothetical protein
MVGDVLCLEKHLGWIVTQYCAAGGNCVVGWILTEVPSLFRGIVTPSSRKFLVAVYHKYSRFPLDYYYY